ncbi:radical SAM protein [Pseudomonas izuensis]|uniref:radical SAM protein n=1 Tax=Pseudomonas izuensis TaxID=2684212 RepID=UPI00135C0CD6|nr:radical SAM protein [Pseudomonas izuensis]
MPAQVTLPVCKEAPGPTKRAILQIHPSLRCNLSCPHCYSCSSPVARTELSPEVVCNVISDAASMGYEVVSVSGGEPFLYVGLNKILSHAKSLGLRTTVTTNGFFTGKGRLDTLREILDVLAFSLDGPPEIHNSIRGSDRAFDRLLLGVKDVKNAEIPFGFINCLTRKNWQHLIWTASFAADNGASLLQVHPLELSGRAEHQMITDFPSDEILKRVYIIISALEAKYYDTMRIQLDLLYREHLLDDPALVYADFERVISIKTPPSEALGLLVLESDGTLVPVSYGFSRNYKLCNVNERRLKDAWPEYFENRYPSLQRLFLSVWNQMRLPESPTLCNWHELIVSRSHTMTV